MDRLSPSPQTIKTLLQKIILHNTITSYKIVIVFWPINIWQQRRRTASMVSTNSFRLWSPPPTTWLIQFKLLFGTGPDKTGSRTKQVYRKGKRPLFILHDSFSYTSLNPNLPPLIYIKTHTKFCMKVRLGEMCKMFFKNCKSTVENPPNIFHRAQ